LPFWKKSYDHAVGGRKPVPCLQVVILGICTFVGLNPQQSVPSLTIIETFLGLLTGMVIAALVGRLIWPVLPQKLLKDDLVNFFKQLTALLNRDPHPEKIRTQLAVLPVEAQQAARQIKIMGYSAAEREKINRLIRAMQALVMQSMALLSEPQPLPDNLRSALRPEFDGLETEFHRMLDTFVRNLRKGDCRQPVPTLRDAMTKLRKLWRQFVRTNCWLNKSLRWCYPCWSWSIAINPQPKPWRPAAPSCKPYSSTSTWAITRCKREEGRRGGRRTQRGNIYHRDTEDTEFRN
jgi:hypothetical protein